MSDNMYYAHEDWTHDNFTDAVAQDERGPWLTMYTSVAYSKLSRELEKLRFIHENTEATLVKVLGENEALRAKVAELEIDYDKLNSFVKRFDGTHAADEWLETEMQNIKLNKRIEKLRYAIKRAGDSPIEMFPGDLEKWATFTLTQDDEMRGAE